MNAERKTHGVDLDGVRFQRMVQQERDEVMNTEHSQNRASPSTSSKVSVMVRKRPLSSSEAQKKTVDVITCVDNSIVVHEPKTKVDCTKSVESCRFDFDAAFSEDATNEDVYERAVLPLVDLCLQGGRYGTEEDCSNESSDPSSSNATVFAYGQTGSGKTHTMTNCYANVARDICHGAYEQNLELFVSFFEIYAGKCFDLLNDRALVNALEDANGAIQIKGLKTVTVKRKEEVLALAETGAENRVTSKTDANSSSSRSHSIFQIKLRRKLGDGGGKWARLALVDLAGSERGADRGKFVSEKIKRESSEINKSLLALKECIRALGVCGSSSANNANTDKLVPNYPMDEKDNQPQHVPFRGSKLTTVLRDAFVGKHSKTVLLAHVSPGHVSAEHTVNTLRYAIRLKDKEKDDRCVESTFAKEKAEKEKVIAEKKESKKKKNETIHPLCPHDENVHRVLSPQLFSLGNTSYDRHLERMLNENVSSDARVCIEALGIDSEEVEDGGSRSDIDVEDASACLEPFTLVEKRRSAFESGRVLLDVHRLLAKVARREADVLLEAEQALALVERNGIGVNIESENNSETQKALTSFYETCDRLAQTLERRTELENKARTAAEVAKKAQEEAVRAE